MGNLISVSSEDVWIEEGRMVDVFFLPVTKASMVRSCTLMFVRFRAQAAQGGHQRRLGDTFRPLSEHFRMLPGVGS